MQSDRGPRRPEEGSQKRAEPGQGQVQKPRARGRPPRQFCWGESRSSSPPPIPSTLEIGKPPAKNLMPLYAPGQVPAFLSLATPYSPGHHTAPSSPVGLVQGTEAHGGILQGLVAPSTRPPGQADLCC